MSVSISTDDDPSNFVSMTMMPGVTPLLCIENTLYEYDLTTEKLKPQSISRSNPMGTACTLFPAPGRPHISFATGRHRAVRINNVVYEPVITTNEEATAIIPRGTYVLRKKPDVVYLKAGMIEWIKRDILNPIQKRYIKTTKHHPDDPVDQHRCKCHYKWRSTAYCSGGKQTWSAWKEPSKQMDPCDLWKDKLLDKHQCHWCGCLFSCNQTQSGGWACNCCYGRCGRWYCSHCGPDPVKYNPYFAFTREQELSGLYAFLATLVLHPVTGELERIPQPIYKKPQKKRASKRQRTAA
jgi:hypothetical protein